MSKGDKARVPMNRHTAALVARLWRESVRPYLGFLLLALGFMVVFALAEAANIKMLEPVVDRVFVEQREDLLWPIAGTVMLLFVIKGLANYGQAGLMSFLGLRVVADMQDRLFAHLCRMDTAYFQATSTGRLVSRFTIDANVMRGAVSNALTGIGKDTLSVIALVALMFHQDAMLASVVFFVFPLAFWPVVVLGRRMRKVSVNTQEEMGSLTTILEQAFQGIRVVKAYRMEGYEQSRVRTLVETVFGLSYKGARVRALSRPLMEVMGGLAIAVVIVYGGWRVIEGVTTPGAFFSFIAALMTAYRPMKALANLNVNLQEGLAGAERLFAVFDQSPAIVDAPDVKPLQVSQGAMHLDNVTFHYEGQDMAALEGVNLTIPGGSLVALVGPSGAGKSTVLNLIPRFFEPTAGRVLVDGQDVREVTLDSLRRSIALVSQEITLFDDSIAANIAYGRPSASMEEVRAAAADAAALDFIEALPEGFDTVVGERGLRLSGGQRQRLAIARAMLKDAPILLLDEATSALDTESERHVQAALNRLMQGRTTLVIAHRLSTVTAADVIHVMDHGRVVESGSHDALVALGGLYAKLHSMQFAAEAAAEPA